MSAVDAMFLEIFAETESELKTTRDAEEAMISPLLRGEYERYKTTPFIQKRRYRTTNKNVDLTTRFRHNHSNKNNKAIMKIKLQLGDEIKYDGKPQMVVWGDDKKARISTTAGETTLINRTIDINYRTTIGDDAALQNFLTTSALTLEILNNKPPGEEKDESNMSRKATQKAGLKKPVGTNKPIAKPRGGLAAEALAAKGSTKEPGTRKNTPATPAATDKGRSKGKLGKLFEHSVVSVIRAAGKAGATFEQVNKVLAAHKIEASDATVKASIRYGKSGTIDGAELTKAQLAEFGV